MQGFFSHDHSRHLARSILEKQTSDGLMDILLTTQNNSITLSLDDNAPSPQQVPGSSLLPIIPTRTTQLSRLVSPLCYIALPYIVVEDEWEIFDESIAATHDTSTKRSPAPIYTPSSSPSPLLRPTIVATKKTSSQSRKRAAGHIPRPKNAFMCYRSYYCAQHKEATCGEKVDHRIMSVEAGKKWRQMSKEEKAGFIAEAAAHKALHAKKYPDYKYKPVRPAGSPLSTPVKRNSGPRKASKAQKQAVVMPQVELEAPEVIVDAQPEANDNAQLEVDKVDQEEVEEFVPTDDIPPLDICPPLLCNGMIMEYPIPYGPIPSQVNNHHFPAGLSFREDFTGYISHPTTPSIIPLPEPIYDGAASFTTVPLVPISPEFELLFRDFTFNCSSRSPTPALSDSPRLSNISSCDSYSIISPPSTPPPASPPLSTDCSSFELQYLNSTESNPVKEEWMSYIDFDKCS